MYVAPTDLADAGYANELAQVATPQRYQIVADDLMEATLRGEDRSAFDPDDVAVADLALERVTLECDNATGTINGFLAMRKPQPYTLPLDPVPQLVKVWARSIARYLLHKDRFGTEEKSDPIVRDYYDALKFLALVRDGKFSLGADDPLPAASSGAPQVCAPERQFTMDSLRDFGC